MFFWIASFLAMTQSDDKTVPRLAVSRPASRVSCLASRSPPSSVLCPPSFVLCLLSSVPRPPSSVKT